MAAIKDKPEITSQRSVQPLETENTEPGLRDGDLSRRLTVGLGVSIAANVIIWTVASNVVHTHRPVQLVPITIERIVLPPKVKPPVLHHKPVVKPPPKPIVKPTQKPVVVQHASPPPPKAPPPPPTSHNQVLAAKGSASPSNPAVPSGGRAPLGVPTPFQGPGNGTKPAPLAPPPPPPAPPTPEPKPAPPAPAPPAPAPPPPPLAPVGPTQDATVSNTLKPEIPDDLMQDVQTTHVFASFTVHADGSFSVKLLTSSGSLEVDQILLRTLNEARGKPALKNGQPIDSTFRFRYNFEGN